MNNEQHHPTESHAGATSADASRSEKRNYHSPQPLRRWGSLTELTHGAGEVGGDLDESGSSFGQIPG